MVEIIGDKWSMLILRDIIFESKRHFNEFRQSEEKIASNILTDRLQMLDREGLLTKRADPEHKQKVVYCLTQKSIDLLPMLVESITWSLKYEPVDTIRYKAEVALALAGVGAREELRELLIKMHL